MQIPLLSGVYTDTDLRFRTNYPVNLTPIPTPSGISNLYLKPSDGVVQTATGLGSDRGAINWNGDCYRVSGDRLIKMTSESSVTDLGAVGGTTQVSMDYSFDRLAIASNNNLYYYDGSTLSQVTDPDLGTVIDVIFIDGYFMTTDGEFLVVTDLSDPFSVNPLKYGSSEVDPDPVVAIKKIRNEVYAVNRYTIEVFDNVGGEFFPFQRIDGAQIPKGCVGTHACCVYDNFLCFIGGGRNESVGVYMGGGAQAAKISTQEVDTLFEDLTEAQLAAVVMESRTDKSNQFLYIHLPDRTLVYDAAASKATNAAVWHVLTSSPTAFSQYLARNFVYAFDKWVCADPTSNKIGTLSGSTSEHWGVTVRWEFDTVIFYNQGTGAVFHELELVALDGTTSDTAISTSHSFDGQTFSEDAGATAGNSLRISWRRQGRMRQWRIQRFKGDSDARLSIAALEARLEPLAF
jgi:hypothetical protein